MLIGPSAFGKLNVFNNMLFPAYYMHVLEPMAHYALVLYAFLMGLQMDIRAITRSGTQALHVAVAGVFIPFVVGSTLYFVSTDEDIRLRGTFFWGAALSVTGFPVLARILEKQKILLTEIGKTALASALLSDVFSWFFLAIGFALTVSHPLWIIITTSALVLLSTFYLRPALAWIIRNTPVSQGYSEYYICCILTGVSLMGVITDVCGTHPMIGAFIFGLIIPNDVLESLLLDRLSDFVHGILMPIFFLVCGLRANLDDIGTSPGSWIKMALVIIFAFAAKIIGAVAVFFLHDLQPGQAVAVGILSNTKSTVALIILEVGLTQGALLPKSYILMIVAILVMTMVVTPAISLYRPSKNQIPYKRRTIQKGKSDEELRVLACIYDTKNVPSIINLLHVSNSTPRSPINIFVLHLIELTGRASAMLVVHTSNKSGPRNNLSYIEAQTDQIASAFDNFELRCEGVHTQVLAARSPYATMDEDICSIANDKRATIIILPFNRQQDKDMEDLNPSAEQNVNESVMANAPCTVGILVDRGGLADPMNQIHGRRIAMLFFGGPDDREALAYAWRMAEHPDTELRVVRFIPSQEIDMGEEAGEFMEEDDEFKIEIDSKRDQAVDDDFLNKFRVSTVNDSSVKYVELVLNDEEEAVDAIKDMDNEDHDLYIVGKGRGVISPLTSGLTDWCDCPELGPIGDLLVTSEFESTFSVLVVQQYIKSSTSSASSTDDNTFGSTNSVIQRRNDADFRNSASESETFEPLASFRKRDPYNPK
ncbi:OLC1v1021017C1 [Oldenlandia corymbosa var. corymbosa]|nr:OLC1v1021017C1 [Oldenlandia corymbosa var. corymbosa]